ncbi:MAG: ATP-dependent metallopeptidase FtsH/Yme1/Tma family protein, partial [Rhodobacteraceae bacterium]|nr:ATP-dependent metallopeptidase FtsH/Yme1/Tma family protein [Paracoccaceae bacterium]MCB2150811.1 ATP-dependent metallopeptidase FtsH/Yme1/Tma family protein [Paracoccaceae bacterium]
MGNARNLAFWVVLFLLVLALFTLFKGDPTSVGGSTISYSQFMDRVDKGEVESVVLDGETVQIRTTDGKQLVTVRPAGESIADQLIAKNVDVTAKRQEQSGFLSLFGFWLPFLVLIGVWIFFMNRMQGGGKGGAMGFGKSRAKLLTERQG